MLAGFGLRRGRCAGGRMLCLGLRMPLERALWCSGRTFWWVEKFVVSDGFHGGWKVELWGWEAEVGAPWD
jgi:hypothetical protein